MSVSVSVVHDIQVTHLVRRRRTAPHTHTHTPTTTTIQVSAFFLAFIHILIHNYSFSTQLYNGIKLKLIVVINGRF